MMDNQKATETENKQSRLALCSMDSILMRAVADYLLECGAASQCVLFRRGQVLLQDLFADGPAGFDGIVLDTTMQDMDALEFMMRLHAVPLEGRPSVILLTMPELVCRMQKHIPGEVDTFLYKPLNPEILAERVSLFCTQKKRGAPSEVARLLQDWGIADGQTQEKYFVTAVEILKQAGGRLALRKELFPVVAQRYGVSVSAVDSGLRRMIDTLEEIQAPAYLAFKERSGWHNRRPTVKGLLCGCIGMLLAERRKENPHGERPKERGTEPFDGQHHQPRNGAATEPAGC